MIDVIRDAERRSLNVLPLVDLLEGTDGRFRSAVMGALLREGFELDEAAPCLQHPLELLEAVRSLDTPDFRKDWKSFFQALLAASRTGILMDLSRNAKGSGSPVPTRPSARVHRHRREVPPASLLRIEYRHPGDEDRWSWFGATTRPGWAQELLEVCRRNHPGSECRIQDDAGSQRRAGIL